MLLLLLAEIVMLTSCICLAGETKIVALPLITSSPIYSELGWELPFCNVSCTDTKDF